MGRFDKFYEGFEPETPSQQANGERFARFYEGFEPENPPEEGQEDNGIIDKAGRLAAKVFTGLEDPLGTGFKALGTELKGLADSTDAKNNPNLSGSLYRMLGGGAESLGEYFLERAHSPEREKAFRDSRWAGKGLSEILSNPSTAIDYATDFEGLASDFSYGLGNAAYFATLAKLFPGGAAKNAADKILKPAEGLLGKIGLNKAAQAVGSDTAKELLGNSLQFGSTMAPAGALINAGTIIDSLREQGYSDAEIKSRMNDLIMEELPADILFAMLTGNVAKGQLGRLAGTNSSLGRKVFANSLGIPLEGVGGAYSNLNQMILSEKYSNKPYGELFGEHTPEEEDAARLGALAGTPFSVVGAYTGVRNAQARDRAEAARKEPYTALSDLLGGVTRDEDGNVRYSDSSLYNQFRQDSEKYREESARLAARYAQAEAERGGLRDWSSNITGGVMSDEVHDLIVREAQASGVDPRLALAVAKTESNGNQDEISPVGAIGVMQLMPETAQGLGVDPYDTAQNIHGGIQYLKQMLDRFNGDTRLATAAYNAGAGSVEKYGGIPPFAETQAYVERIHDLLNGSPDYGGSEDRGQVQDNGYYGEGGAGEGKTWVRVNGSSLDGAQPQLLDAIDMLADWLYKKTGRRLFVTSGTDGSSHVGGEHSHYNGWKVDVVDEYNAGEDSDLITASYQKGHLADEFIAYGRSLGLGMNFESAGTDNVHFDITLDGTQWDGNGEDAGGFNPRNSQNARPSSSQENSYDNNFSAKENEMWQAAQRAAAYANENYGMNLQPDWLYRQLAVETGNFTSPLSEYHNYGGLKGGKKAIGEDNRGHKYFANDDDFFEAYLEEFIKLRPELKEAKSVEDFARIMKETDYYQADYKDYIADMKGIAVPKSKSVQSRADDLYNERMKHAPQWQDYLKDKTRQQEETESATTTEPTKPNLLSFPPDRDDDETKTVYDSFAKDRMNKALVDEDVDSAMFLRDMFKGNEFRNTPENRAAIAERYGDDFTQFAQAFAPTQQSTAQAQPAQGTPNPRAQTATAQPIKPNAGSKFLRNDPVIQAGRQFLDELNKNGSQGNTTALRLQTAIAQGDATEVENILKANNRPTVVQQQDTQAQTQQTPQAQQDPVRQNTTPDNVLSQQQQQQQETSTKKQQLTGEEKAIKHLQKPVERGASGRTKKLKGNAILKLADANGIEIPEADRKSLANGKTKTVNSWRDNLIAQGIVPIQGTTRTTKAQQQQTATQENVPTFEERANQVIAKATQAAGENWNEIKRAAESRGTAAKANRDIENSVRDVDDSLFREDEAEERNALREQAEERAEQERKAKQDQELKELESRQKEERRNAETRIEQDKQREQEFAQREALPKDIASALKPASTNANERRAQGEGIFNLINSQPFKDMYGTVTLPRGLENPLRRGEQKAIKTAQDLLARRGVQPVDWTDQNVTTQSETEAKVTTVQAENQPEQQTQSITRDETPVVTAETPERQPKTDSDRELAVAAPSNNKALLAAQGEAILNWIKTPQFIAQYGRVKFPSGLIDALRSGNRKAVEMAQRELATRGIPLAGTTQQQTQPAQQETSTSRSEVQEPADATTRTQEETKANEPKPQQQSERDDRNQELTDEEAERLWQEEEKENREFRKEMQEAELSRQEMESDEVAQREQAEHNRRADDLEAVFGKDAEKARAKRNREDEKADRRQLESEMLDSRIDQEEARDERLTKIEEEDERDAEDAKLEHRIDQDEAQENRKQEEERKREERADRLEKEQERDAESERIDHLIDTDEYETAREEKRKREKDPAEEDRVHLMPAARKNKAHSVDEDSLQHLINIAWNSDMRAELEAIRAQKDSFAARYNDDSYLYSSHLANIYDEMYKVFEKANERDVKRKPSERIPESIKRCRTADDLEAYWQAQHNPRMVFSQSVKKLYLPALKEFLSGVEKAFELFPAMHDRLTYINAKRSSSYTACVDCRVNARGALELTLNTKAFVDAESTDRYTTYIKNHPGENNPKNASLAGIGAHEAMHIISVSLFKLAGGVSSFSYKKSKKYQVPDRDGYAKTNKDLTQWAGELLSPDGKTPLSAKNLRAEREAISKYALTNFDETVAEAVMEFHDNGGNASPLSKAIVQRIREALKGDTWREHQIISKTTPDDVYLANLNTATVAKWYEARKAAGDLPLERAQEVAREFLHDRGLAKQLARLEGTKAWEDLLKAKTPNEKVLETGEWTDEAINELAKHSTIENLIKNLGGEIVDGKVHLDAKGRKNLIHCVETVLDPNARYSYEGVPRNFDMSNIVAPEKLTGAQKLLQQFADKLGVKMVFFDNPNGGFHGAFADGVTFLNVNSKKGLDGVFWHESFHWLKANNPKLYAKLVDAAEITDADRQAFLNRTGRTDLATDEAIDEEILADQMDDVAKRTGLMQSIAGKNRGLVQRVVQWLKDTMNKFIETFRNPTGGLKTAQAKALANEFGRIASRLKDADGNAIFRVNNRTGDIEVIGGREATTTTREQIESAARPDNVKYSIDTNDNSSESWGKRATNFVKAMFGGKKPTKSQNQIIVDALSALAKHKIYFGLNGKNAPDYVVDSFQKAIFARHGYDFKTLLPVVGKQIAKSLGLAESDEMSNYIADWMMTGALNNTSAEAKAFQKAMRDNPGEAELLMAVRNSFDTLSKMTPYERFVNSMARAEKKKPKRGDFMEEWVDDLNPIKALEDRLVAKTEDPSIARLIKDKLAPYLHARIGKGKGALSDMMIGTKGMSAQEIQDNRDVLGSQFTNVDFSEWNPLQAIVDHAGGDMEGLEVFSLAKLEKEMYEKLREVDENGNPKHTDLVPSHSEADCDAIIKAGEKKFGKAQEELVAYANTLAAIQYTSGLITAKQFYQMVGGWENYVPTARVFDEDEPYSVDLKAADNTKQKKGSYRRIVNPLQKLAANTEVFLRQAIRNDAKLRVVAMARCGGFGEVFAEAPKGDTRGHSITFREDGQIKHLVTPDESIVRALESIQTPADSNVVIQALKTMGLVMRGVYTMFNSEFAVGNVFRDMPDSFIHNKYGSRNPLIMVPMMVKTAVDGFAQSVGIRAQDKAFKEFLAHGGTQSGFSFEITGDSSSRVDDMAGNIPKWKKVWRTFIKAAEASENMTRYATYKTALDGIVKEQGGTATEYAKDLAALQARSATVDFARAGRSMRSVNKYLLFSNAAVQSLSLWGEKGYNAAKGKKGARAEFAGAVFKTIMAGVVPAMLASLFNYSDDDRRKRYGALHSWEKDNYWVLATDLGGYSVRIPKGMDVMLRLTSALTEEFMSYVAEDKPAEWKRVATLLRNGLPSITTTVFTPLIETWVNYSIFKDAPIVPYGEQDDPKYKQYGKNTSPLAKALGKVFDKSPRMIDHLISGYGGSQATWVASGFSGVPLILRRFLFDPDKNPRVVQDYYQKLNEQNELLNEYKARREDGEKVDLPEDYDRALHARLKAIQEPLRKISRAEKQIMESDKFDDDQKKERIRKLEEKRVALCERVLKKAR